MTYIKIISSRLYVRTSLQNSQAAKSGMPSTKTGLFFIDRKKLYINESLSKQNKRLFSSCLEYKKANRYKYIWTKNRKTFLKQGDESDVIVINKEKYLLQYNITDGIE